MANSAIHLIDNIDENKPVANLSGAENENPGALAGATGAKSVCEKTTPEAYTARLNLASAAIRALADCHPEDRNQIISQVIEKTRTGEPIPPLGKIMAEARDWASWANRAEIKAYAAACFEAMAAPDRARFLAFAGKGGAA